MMNILSVLIFSVLVILSVLMALFLYSWYRLRKNIFAPSDPNPDTPTTYHLKYQTKTFITEDGIKLKGWYIPAKHPKAVIIIVHGYIDTKASMLSHAKFLHDGGYSTFLIDLRSDYQRAKYTLGVHEWKDAKAAYDFMKPFFEKEKLKIGFYAGSMGAAISIIAAGKTNKGDFILVSVPYANFKRLFTFQLQAQKLPTFLLPFLHLAAIIEFGIGYNEHSADRYIKKIKVPLLLMAAAQDETVNKHDAQYLFNLANEPKHFWQAEAGHNIMIDKPEELKQKVIKFLEEHI